MQPSEDVGEEPCPVCGGEVKALSFDPQEAIFLQCTAEDCDWTDQV